MTTDDVQDLQAIEPPPSTPTDAGPPPLEVVSGEVVDRGPHRNGIFGTWLPILIAVLSAVLAALKQADAIDWTLGWTQILPVLIPTLWVSISKVRS